MALMKAQVVILLHIFGLFPFRCIILSTYVCGKRNFRRRNFHPEIFVARNFVLTKFIILTADNR